MHGDLDDDVRINTNDKTVKVSRTNDNFDKIFVDGAEVAGTPKGFLAEGLIAEGYSISMKGPQAVGMGLTDFALTIFGSFGILKYGYHSITTSSQAARFIINNAGTINKGNFWRLGIGRYKGLNIMRLAWGSDPNYLN